MGEKIKTIISFGHLPKEVGGKQYSGLSQVMWRLANEINKLQSEYRVIFIATDIHISKVKIEHTEVLGWDIGLFVKSFLKNFKFNCKQLTKAKNLWINYKYPLVNSWIKLVLWNQILSNQLDSAEFIHVHGVNNYMMLDGLLKTYKKKIILTLHGITGVDETQVNMKIQFELENYVNHCDRIDNLVFITEEIRKKFFQLYGQSFTPTSVILNGFDPNIFYFHESERDFVTNSKISLVTIGGISKLKGQIRIINALSKLPDQMKRNYVLTMIGVGHDEEISVIKEISKNNNVELHYLGYKEPLEIAKVLRKSDYMILPSSSEGFGLVFLESIACGTPVILPKNLPLALEVNVLNSYNSIKINDHSIEAIYNCLYKLTKFPYSRELVSSTIDHLKWEMIAKQYVILFNLMLTTKR